MHRPLRIAAFLLVLASMPLWAQHGGGHGSSGSHAGGGGGFSSHGGFSGGGFHGGGFQGGMSGGHSFGGSHSFSGSRSFSGPRSFSGAHSPHSFSGARSYSGSHSRYGYAPYSRGSASGPSLASRSPRGHGHSGVGVRIRSYGYGYGNNCGVYGCGAWGYGYPYLYGGIDPYWWWDSGSPDDSGAQYDAGQNNYNDYNQGVGDPWRPPDQGDPDEYASSAPPHQPERTEALPATVLIFHDQHRQEVNNYAIVGDTLWNFAPQHTQKIPLSALDIPATTKINDDRGVDFRLPTVSEDQQLHINIQLRDSVDN